MKRETPVVNEKIISDGFGTSDTFNKFFVKIVPNLKIFLKKPLKLRILTVTKHRQITLQRLQKVEIWAFGSLVNKSTLYKMFLN